METELMTRFAIVAGFLASFVFYIVFSASASALMTISRGSIRKMMENKIRGARHLFVISGNRQRYSLMFQSGQVITTVTGAIFLLAMIRFLFPHFAGTILWPIALILAVFVYIAAETIIARFVAFGEYEDTVPRFAYFLFFSFFILYPITFVLDLMLSILIEKNQEIAAKEEALIEFVKSESEAGVIELEEQEMIEGVLDFSDTTVREVMVPRIDMIAVEKDTPTDELITLFKKEGHSRIPVYEGRIDNILGVIYAKDILPIIAEKGKEAFSIVETMRKAYFVTESKKISDLLAEFKKAKVHLAVVVDEYGGTAGIVALEDLLEEIVGDIFDEYDTDERDYIWINDRTVLMDAGLDIDDVNDIIHSDIEGDEFDTLGGFIYHRLGVIPRGGEEFKWDNLTFTIKQIDGNRISKVLVQLDEPLLKSREDRSRR